MARRANAADHRVGAGATVPHVAVSEEQVADLRAGPAATPWPDEIDGSDWDYGSISPARRRLMQERMRRDVPDLPGLRLSARVQGA